MAKSVLKSARRALTASASADGLVGLVTVTPFGGGDPVRVATDGARLSYRPDRFGVVSRGHAFDFVVMRFLLPDDVKDVIPSTSLEFDNVDPAIVAATQLSVYRARLDLEVVLMTDPDTVVERWPGLLVTRAAFNVNVVTVDASFDPLFTEPLVALRLTADVAPALRKAA